MSQATPTSTGTTHRPTGLAFIAVALLVGATTICWRAAVVVAAPEDAGSIAGFVTGTGNAPLQGICVNVPNAPEATTDIDGRYQIDGVGAGDWTVQFVDCTATPIYITQWYNGQTDQNKADKVTVEADRTTAANAQLTPGVAVSGRVTGPGGEDGVAGINVNVNPYETNGPSAYAQTAADGTYRTGPLPDGTYRVQFSDGTGTWANQYWSGQPLWNSATKLPLSVAQGSEQRAIDAVLVAGATITGQVTDPDMVALGGICVSADTPDNGWYSTVAGTSTNPGDGTYTLTAVPSGLDLRLHFFPCSGPSSFVEEWYENATDPRQSTAIFLNGGETRHIDSTLARGIQVAGTVTDRNGAPLPGINVNVFRDNAPGGFAQTDQNGHYLTGAVSPGAYRVQFRDDNGVEPNYAAQYWEDELTYGTARLLTVTSDDVHTRDGVDARLDIGAMVSGIVTGPGDLPVPGECVNLLVQTRNGPEGVDQVRTDANGRFRFTGVAPTTAWVQFDDCNGDSIPYQTVFWHSAAQFEQATPIDLAAGANVTGIDQRLELAGAIRGHVAKVGDVALPGICVQAVTATAFGDLTRTDQNGNYQLALSAAGDYTVQFVDCNEPPSYAGQTAPAPVHVEPGGVVDHLDAVLVAGGTASLSGSMRNADGLAMKDACAVAYVANMFARFAIVGADGTFTIAGIPSGTFAVAFAAATPADCERGNVSATLTDPVNPAITYQAKWWGGVDLGLAGTNDGGPDPIAQGATLVAIGAGQALTGFDMCFGCVTPPPTTTTTTTATTATTTSEPATTTTVLPPVVIRVVAISRAPGTITLSFVAEESALDAMAAARGEALPASTIFIATCTSPTGPTGTATGTALQLTVGGVDDRAAYTCTVAVAIDGVPVAVSAAELVAPLGSTLPATGSDVDGSVPVAILVILGGAALALIARRRQTT